MLEYPSIAHAGGQSFREFKAHVFDKLDGSNLRFEWSKKKGWYKQGTRTRLFDESDPEFGKAIKTFKHAANMDHNLCVVARKHSWDRMVAFVEWYGRDSFAGWHNPEHEWKDMEMALIDISIDGKALMPPKEFVKTFSKSDVATPEYYGVFNWTRGFVAEVRKGNLPGWYEGKLNLLPDGAWRGHHGEGVVGKAEIDGRIVMAKAKTQQWVDRVKARYTAEEAEKIITS